MSIVDPHIYGPWLGDQSASTLLRRYTEALKEDPSLMANIRIEKIENGYIVVYSKQGISEKRRYAKDMRDVGDAVIAACTELELTGK